MSIYEIIDEMAKEEEKTSSQFVMDMWKHTPRNPK